MRRLDIVFIGDSITFAWPVPFEARGRRIHRGVPCETSRTILDRFDADVVQAAPRVVHIMAGTNDVAGNDGAYDEAATLDAIGTMVTRAQAAGIAVLLASVPPAAVIPWNARVDAVASIGSLNVALTELGGRAGVGFVDYRPVLDDGAGGMRRAFTDDGLHPNDAGYAAMEPIAALAIDAALRRHPSR